MQLLVDRRNASQAHVRPFMIVGPEPMRRLMLNLGDGFT